jgi:putative DNA-invertase from lambdoid prophage Rac
MSRVFAYCRVSTDEQTIENQMMEIRAAGFALEPHRVVEAVISGSSAAAQRDGFKRLLDRLERDDVLVTSKLDRLGRNVIDVVTTVDCLAERGIKVHCLQLGGADLTSAAGRLTMNVLAAVAQFERDLLIERTQAGLRGAVGQGKKLGRKPQRHRPRRDPVCHHRRDQHLETSAGVRHEPTDHRASDRRMTDRVRDSEDLLRAMVGEAAMLTRADRARLVELLGMCGSQHDGESAAAATAIERLRRERGPSWAAILGLV